MQCPEFKIRRPVGPTPKLLHHIFTKPRALSWGRCCVPELSTLVMMWWDRNVDANGDMEAHGNGNIGKELEMKYIVWMLGLA